MSNHCMFLIESNNMIMAIKKKIKQPTVPQNRRAVSLLSVTNTRKPIKDIDTPIMQIIKSNTEYLILVFIRDLAKFLFIVLFYRKFRL